MVLQKLKVALAVILAVAMTAAGAGVWAQQTSQADSDAATRDDSHPRRSRKRIRFSLGSRSGAVPRARRRR